MLIILNIAITICFTSYYDSDFSVFLFLHRRDAEPLPRRVISLVVFVLHLIVFLLWQLVVLLS